MRRTIRKLPARRGLKRKRLPLCNIQELNHKIAGRQVDCIEAGTDIMVGRNIRSY